MATTTKFIAVADFADYADISQYLSTDYINPHILSAQEQFVRPILGDDLYTELQTQVAASTETALNLALLAKIKPYLVYKSYQQFLLHHGVYSTNMGLRTYKDENSEEISTERRAAISNNAGNLAEMYKSQLLYYLSENASSYPLYTDCSQPRSKTPRIGKIAATHRKTNDFYI